MNFKKEEFSEILTWISYSYGSINKMANKLGITASYISRLIRLHYNSPPSPEVLRKIADNSNHITNYIDLMYICGYLNDNDCAYLKNKCFNTNDYKIVNPKNHNFILYYKLNETGQKKVNDYMTDLIDTNKYKN